MENCAFLRFNFFLGCTNKVLINHAPAHSALDVAEIR